MERQVLGGRYQLDDVVGIGGMSTVWRARDRVLDRNVAVKLLSGRYAADAAARQRIRVEARAAAGLAHPNVAQVHDFGETVEAGRRTPYVVMELVPGPTLEERTAAGPLAPAVVLRVCAEVAAGLAAAHADGLVHRDVKPANVILAPTGAKLLDFGIATVAGPAGAAESDDELFGTPDYLAPERLTDDAVTPASDVYSLGVLLYRLLAGHRPWPASGAADLLVAHLETDPAPLPDRPGVAPEVAELCRRCLAKDPAARPTAGEVATALAAAAGIRTVTDDLAYRMAPPAVDGVSSTILVRLTATAAAHRRRARLAAAGVLAAAAALIAGLVIAGPGRTRPAAAPPQPPAPAPATVGGGAAAPPAPGPAPSAKASATLAVVPGTGAAGAATGATTGAAPPAATTAAPAGSPAPAPAEAAPTVPAQTFTSEGGTIRAGCTADGRAELLSWTAAAPYRVDRVDSGPAAAASAAFARGNIVVDMTVTCTGTAPAETTTRRTK
ncbi:serine/threonine-protein kinase [Dactylosporangium sp. McL0621]|uniref:serine/threonine-protein kinase n=1 Tax=Dactylosporangium sp. McL0621 TaxID=3415678 RepID=UPI003CF4EF80